MISDRLVLDQNHGRLDIRNYSQLLVSGAVVLLCDLPRYTSAIVQSVEPIAPDDAIAQRLSALGFVRGEQVRLITVGPFGGDPILVQVGFTRFALRRSEAARVHVHVGWMNQVNPLRFCTRYLSTFIAVPHKKFRAKRKTLPPL